MEEVHLPMKHKGRTAEAFQLLLVWAPGSEDDSGGGLLARTEAWESPQRLAGPELRMRGQRSAQDRMIMEVPDMTLRCLWP